MKIGDLSCAGKKVSFNAQDLIGKQLENLTSMVYNMSIQKEEGKKPVEPQVYTRRGRGQRRQSFDNRDRGRSLNDDRQRQNFRQMQDRCGNSNRRENYRQNYNRNNSRDRGRQNFGRNFSNDRSRSRERSPTPRRNGNRYNSPNTNLGTRSRSHSRVTTDRDRIRCFRCREYDHLANECPNAGIDYLEGYESDSTALQLMTTEMETHESFDTTRMIEEADHLNI